MLLYMDGFTMNYGMFRVCSIELVLYGLSLLFKCGNGRWYKLMHKFGIDLGVIRSKDKYATHWRGNEVACPALEPEFYSDSTF